MKLSAILAALAFTGLAAASPASHSKHAGSSKAVHIASQSDFCLFVPAQQHNSKAAVDLGLEAKTATAVCTTGNSTFPSGFIQSAHVLKTHNYVQVTGKLSVAGRYTGYQQFDSQVPKHSRCKGYKTFVGIIDAEAGQFCLRCCNSNDCPTDKASLGCQVLIPGKY